MESIAFIVYFGFCMYNASYYSLKFNFNIGNLPFPILLLVMINRFQLLVSTIVVGVPIDLYHFKDI